MRSENRVDLDIRTVWWRQYLDKLATLEWSGSTAGTATDTSERARQNAGSTPVVRHLHSLSDATRVK